MNNPILEETREARRQLDAEFGGDLDALLVYFRAIECENSERVVKLDPKPPRRFVGSSELRRSF